MQTDSNLPSSPNHGQAPRSQSLHRWSDNSTRPCRSHRHRTPPARRIVASTGPITSASRHGIAPKWLLTWTVRLLLSPLLKFDENVSAESEFERAQVACH